MTSELPRTTGTEETRPVPVVVPRTLGDYELVERIGEGGMGVVWRARSRHGRDVAVKVLRAHIAHDHVARERLRREVHTLARVHHPRVADVVDADVDGPAPYIVTEYVPGPALDKVVAERAPFEGEALLHLGRGLAEALQAIHAAGIVHRDLKPGNVLMVGDGEVLDPVVIDFGIAQVADDVRLTATGMVMGTPGYLSPEVIEGGQVGEATDWWGWAAVLGFAASGKPPFGRGPVTVVLDRVVRGRVQLDGVDPSLQPLLRAALDPDPARRPSQRQVLDGLERYARGEDVTQALPAWVAQEAAAAGGAAASSSGAVAPAARAATTRIDPADATRVQPLGPPTRVAPHRPQPAERQWHHPGPEQQRQAPAPQSRGEGPVPQQQWPPPAGTPYPSSPYPDAPLQPLPGEQGGPDPRIGRSPRTGTLLALLVAFVGLTTNAAVVAWALFAVWGVVARTVDRSLTALVLRRYEAGPRRSDVPVAVLSSPWHLVSAVLSTVFSLVVPVGVAAIVAFVIAGFVTSTGIMPWVGVDHPLPVGIGSLLGAGLAWWGLGSTSLRRGSRTMVRGVVPSGAITTIVTTLFLVGGAALAWYAYRSLGAVSWWPLGPEFDPRGWLPVQDWF